MQRRALLQRGVHLVPGVWSVELQLEQRVQWVHHLWAGILCIDRGECLPGLPSREVLRVAYLQRGGLPNVSQWKLLCGGSGGLQARWSSGSELPPGDVQAGHWPNSSRPVHSLSSQFLLSKPHTERGLPHWNCLKCLEHKPAAVYLHAGLQLQLREGGECGGDFANVCQ